MRPPAVGVFGKLPGRGDFIARDLDPAFTDAWHDWLAHELPAARQALGERFEPAYLVAPVWRFVVAAGLAGSHAVTGVMIPSVDAVGRQFPLTLVASGGPGAEAWYAALEAAAIAALAEDWQDEPWRATLAALPAPDTAAAAAATAVRFWGEGSPFVAAGSLDFPALPTEAAFCRLFLSTGEVDA